MIPVPSGARVWIATGMTDMRKGISSLAMQIQQGFGRNPHAGDLYAFSGSALSGNQHINYMLSRWASFARFVSDGRICMTNNTAERRVRTVAVGRRNWTFCGSDRGDDRAAAMYTLTQTYRLNDGDPHAWLRDVIAQISDHPQTRLHELLPWRWKARQQPLEPVAQAA